MRNFTVYQDWTQEDQNKSRQQIGLFTFYRQQVADTCFVSEHFNKTVISGQKSPKLKTNLKFQKTDEQQKMVYLSHAQSKKKIKISEFLNRITAQPKSISHSKKQNNNLQSPSNSKFQDTLQFKRYNFIMQTTNGFISRPLKNIEQVVKISNDKVFMSKESRRHSKLKNHEKKQNETKQIIKQTQKGNQNHRIEASNSSKSHKKSETQINYSCQKLSANNSLQKSFLSKIRFNQKYQKRRDKQYIISRKMKDIRKQNKKCIFNLLKSVYLPYRDEIQAHKILSTTLKPDFIIKRLKTDCSSLSPNSIRVEKKQMTAIPQKIKILSPQNQQAKVNNFQTADLKPSLNERFRFLIRKQRVINKNFYHDSYKP